MNRSSHLAYISSLSSSSDLSQSSSFRALSAIRDLHELATRNGHASTVGVLALVFELRDLVHNGFWNDVGALLQKVECTLSLNFVSESVGSEETVASPRIMTNLEKVLVIHVLIIGIIFHTYVGNHANTQTRMKHLHDMLDGGALDAFGPSGIIEVFLPIYSKKKFADFIQLLDTIRKPFVATPFHSSNSSTYHIRNGIFSEQRCEKGPCGKETEDEGVCG